MPSPQKKREQLKMQRQKQQEEQQRQWREDYDRLQQAEKEGKKIYKAAGGRIRATSEEELKQKTSKAAKSAVDAELTMVKLRSQEAVKKLKKDRKRKDLSADTQRQEQRSMQQQQRQSVFGSMQRAGSQGTMSMQRSSQSTRGSMGPRMSQEQTPYSTRMPGFSGQQGTRGQMTQRLSRESMFDRAFGGNTRQKRTNRRGSR